MAKEAWAPWSRKGEKPSRLFVWRCPACGYFEAVPHGWEMLSHPNDPSKAKVSCSNEACSKELGPDSFLGVYVPEGG